MRACDFCGGEIERECSVLTVPESRDPLLGSLGFWNLHGRSRSYEMCPECTQGLLNARMAPVRRLDRIDPRMATPIVPPRLRQNVTWLVATPSSC